jgi:hypothetical protein
MEPYLIILALVVLAGVIWAVRRSGGGQYKRFVTEAHLAEMLEIVATLKQSALNHIEDAGQEAALPHPSCMMTSQEGIRVVYTITRENGEYVHHFSLQTASGPTPPPVGEMLMLFIASMLGFPEGRASLARSPRGIYHGEITLTEAEQAEFAAQTPPTRVYAE